MAAIEHTAETRTEVQTEPVIASGIDEQALGSLRTDYEMHGQLTAEETLELKRLQDEVAERLARIEKLKNKRVYRRRIGDFAVEEDTEYLRERLQDPHSAFDRLFRFILLNAEVSGGSLGNRQTHEQAERLGAALVNFNHYRKNSDTPEPLVVVRNIPTIDNPTSNLQLDFGYSTPGAGVKFMYEGEATVLHGNLKSDTVPQPWLYLPVAEEPPMHAIIQSGNNSHFIRDTEQVVRVENGAMFSGSLSKEDDVPEVGAAQLPLPVGNLYARKDEKTFIFHDDPHGNVKEIKLPGNFQNLNRDSAIVIGERAVQYVCGILPGRVEAILGAEKGRVAQAMAFVVGHDEFGLPVEQQ